MDFFLSLLPSVSSLGVAGYVLVSGIALAESLPFIGLVFPGTVFVLLAGFFSSQGYLDFGWLIVSVSFGAALGDWIGYRLGAGGVGFFRREKGILRASHFEKGRKFFRTHGVRSVFFGRFIGSLRPVMPFVAGRAGLSRERFLIVDVAASLLWAWSHLLVGYFFGGAAAVIGTGFTRASAFLLAIASLVFLLWYVARRARRYVRVVRSIVRSIARAIMENPDMGRFADRHPGAVRFLKRRTDRTRFSGRSLTLLSVAFAYLFFLFSGVVEGVVTAEPILLVDQRVANLMYAFRDTGFVDAFLWITLLGRADTVAVVTVAVVAILIFRNRRPLVVPFLVAVGGSQAFVTIGKSLAHRVRPDIAYYAEPSFSFPSGHATLAVALYGFIAYILLRKAGRRFRYRTLILFSTLVTVVGIGLSRLYLGVHFLSDVWGGFLLGSLWLLIGISIAEAGARTRRPDGPTLPWKRFVTIAVLIAVSARYLHEGLRYEPVRSVVVRSEDAVVSDEVVPAFSVAGLPRYSETFSGTHQEPMSFVVTAADDQAFVAAMERAGWLLSDPVTVANMTRLAEISLLGGRYPRAPMTPSFWNTRVHDFGFQKETSSATVHERHHARFWKTPIRGTDGAAVYVGTASLDTGIKWVVTHRIDPDIDTERETFVSDLVSAGVVVASERIRFVNPVLGKNFSGDPFFTDGEAYVLRVR